MSIPPCTRCGFTPSLDTVGSSSWNILEVLRSGHRALGTALSCKTDRVNTLKGRQSLLCKDILRLESVLLQKHKEMAATEIEIRQTESLAAPVRSMPPEVLLFIFSLVREAAAPLHGPTSLFKLGHVCKSWRTLSRSSPSLWSKIDVIKLGEGRGTDRIEEQLVLSSPVPLTIHISSLKSTSSFRQSVNTDRLLGALSGHMARCRFLDVTLTSSSLKSYLRVLDRAHLGMLESLTMTYIARLSEELCTELKSIDLIFYPSLHSIHTSLPLDYFNVVKIHWPSLTSFTGPFSNSSTFLQFLTLARQLVKLNVTCISSYNQVDNASLVHESLRELTLDSFCSVTPALDKITLPHLNDLIIQRTYESHVTCKLHSSVDKSLLSRLIDRSQCRLKSFLLDSGDHDTPVNKIISILRLSSITSFRVLLGMDADFIHRTTRLLDLLTVTPSQICLPNLRTLELKFCTTTDNPFLHKLLTSMIRSRWDVQNDVARLSKLTLTMEEPIEPRPVYSTSMLALLLLDLQDKGLEVSWMMELEDVLKEGREWVDRCK